MNLKNAIMTEKYVKLGEKANSFFDPQTGFSLVPGEIKLVPNSYLRTQRARRFLKGGGITYSSKEEYNEYQDSLRIIPAYKVEAKAVDKEENPEVPLDEMTKASLIEHVEKSGWDQADIDEAKSIKKKAELLDFIKETEKLYE